MRISTVSVDSWKMVQTAEEITINRDFDGAGDMDRLAARIHACNVPTAENAKYKNMNVPTNSPVMAIKCDWTSLETYSPSYFEP